MEKNIQNNCWKHFLPEPVYKKHPGYCTFYMKAWELAHMHIKEIKGMPQTPYMDEGFCNTQIWIWDTCFMSLFCKYAQEVFPGKETLRNFYDVLYNGKELPMVIPTEQDPAWAKKKTGEPYRIQINIADNPPLFAWAEYENALIHGDRAYLKTLLYNKKVLQKHYHWLENLNTPAVLPGVRSRTCWIAEKNGYKWEGGRSGMDNTPRGRIDAPTEKERPNNPDMYWIDAICQQAFTADMISKLFDIIGDSEQANMWQTQFLQKKDIINRYYWDEQDGTYYDIDCNTYRFYKVPTIASYWALTANIANREQAQRMISRLTDENLFGGDVPFVSVARNDPDFVRQGRYWRGSVWLPCAYATLQGLKRYGKLKEAHQLAEKLIAHMWKTYTEYEPHTIWECYSPSEAAPATQTDNTEIVRKDFCGWSALGPISIFFAHCKMKLQ